MAKFIISEPWVFLLLRVTYTPAQLLQVLKVAPLKNLSKIQDSHSVQMYRTFWKLNNSHYHFWIILTWVNIIQFSRNKEWKQNPNRWENCYFLFLFWNYVLLSLPRGLFVFFLLIKMKMLIVAIRQATAGRYWALTKCLALCCAFHGGECSKQIVK